MTRTLWDKIWKDKSGKVVLFELPNAPIIAWAVLTIISMILRGTASTVFWYLSVAALGIWALLEIFRGTNYFRRALGLIVLGLMVANRLGIGR